MTIICTSFNGWPVSRDPDEIGLTTFTMAGRSFTTVKVAAPLFAYVIRRFDAEVDPLLGGILDEWSYNVRQARTQENPNDLPRSNHGSGTAVDLDATQFPRGRVNMTPAQVTAVESILAACGGQIAWGGHFHQAANKDQMHFELAPGTTTASVLAQIAGMRLQPDGVVVAATGSLTVNVNDLVVGRTSDTARIVNAALRDLGGFWARVTPTSSRWTALSENRLQRLAARWNTSRTATLRLIGRQAKAQRRYTVA